MDYLYLSDKDRTNLREQRILALEADHYRLELLIQECLDADATAKLIAQQAKIMEAINAHLGENAQLEAADNP